MTSSPHNPQTPSSTITIIETHVTESSSRTVSSRDHRGNWVTLSMHEGDSEHPFPVMGKVNYADGRTLSLGTHKTAGTLYADCHKNSIGEQIGPFKSGTATTAFMEAALKILKDSTFTAAHATQIEQFIAAVNTTLLKNPTFDNAPLGQALEKHMVEIQKTEFVRDAAGNIISVALDQQTHTGYIDMIGKNGKHVRIDFSPHGITNDPAGTGDASHPLVSPKVAAELESLVSKVYANAITRDEATALSALTITMSGAFEKPEATRAPTISSAIKKFSVNK